MENNKIIKLLENTKYDAHKGNSWEYPENSVSAIDSALFNPNADAVEFDVRMTKDGKLVVRHDDCLFTTSNSFKKVSEMTLEELRFLKFRAHKIDYFIHYFQTFQDRGYEHSKHQRNLLNKLLFKKDRIITLENLLRNAPRGKKLLLEVKDNDEYYKSDCFSKEILELVNFFGDKQIYIHGFDAKLMMWFKENATKAKVGIGLSEDISALDLPLDYACFNLGRIEHQIFDIVKSLEKRPGQDFHFWKVDTLRELRQYIEFLKVINARDLECETSVMSNDIVASKMMINEEIKRLAK